MIYSFMKWAVKAIVALWLIMVTITVSLWVYNQSYPDRDVKELTWESIFMIVGGVLFVSFIMNVIENWDKLLVSRKGEQLDSIHKRLDEIQLKMIHLWNKR